MCQAIMKSDEDGRRTERGTRTSLVSVQVAESSYSRLCSLSCPDGIRSSSCPEGGSGRRLWGFVPRAGAHHHGAPEAECTAALDGHDFREPGECYDRCAGTAVIADYCSVGFGWRSYWLHASRPTSQAAASPGGEAFCERRRVGPGLQVQAG